MRYRTPRKRFLSCVPFQLITNTVSISRVVQLILIFLTRVSCPLLRFWYLLLQHILNMLIRCLNWLKLGKLVSLSLAISTAGRVTVEAVVFNYPRVRPYPIAGSIVGKSAAKVDNTTGIGVCCCFRRREFVWSLGKRACALYL